MIGPVKMPSLAPDRGQGSLLKASFLGRGVNPRPRPFPFFFGAAVDGSDPSEAGFLSVQKATLGTGGRCPQARCVLQGHGVLLFRNRPLGVCCGAALKAQELHFGAGFLSVQKATLGTGTRCPQARSVLQGHGVLLFRNRPLELRCRAVLRAWELHFGTAIASSTKLFRASLILVRA